MRYLIFAILFTLLIPNFGGDGKAVNWEFDSSGALLGHKKVPAHTPEWTDFNESDPGVSNLHANANSVIVVR